MAERVSGSSIFGFCRIPNTNVVPSREDAVPVTFDEVELSSFTTKSNRVECVPSGLADVAYTSVVNLGCGRSAERAVKTGSRLLEWTLDVANRWVPARKGSFEEASKAVPAQSSSGDD